MPGLHSDLHSCCLSDPAVISIMEASQVVQRCIYSALLFFVLVWLCLFVCKFVYAARESRGMLYLPLISCTLTCVCDVVLSVFSELQLRDDGRYESPQSYLLAGWLTEVRE